MKTDDGKITTSEIKKTSAEKIELRKFGFIMGGMFALIFGLVFPWLTDKTQQNWPLWPFIVLAVFWVLAIIAPQILRPVNKIWLKIGNVLGWINSHIILGIMFYLLIFPMGLVLRAMGKDSMNRKLDSASKSYRKASRQRPKKHLERPF